MSEFFAGLWSSLLRVDIMDGPVPLTVYALALVGLVVTLLWRPTRRSLLGALVGAILGVVVAVGLWAVFIRGLNFYGVGLGLPVYALLAATLAGVGVCLAALLRRGTPRGGRARRNQADADAGQATTRTKRAGGAGVARRVVAALTAVAVVAAGTLATNAAFGLNATLASLMGIVVDDPVDLPAPSSSDPAVAPAHPLWSTWKPPADMPKQGQTGTLHIPNTHSGFAARDAGIYLPPAALTNPAPRLPVVVFMYGLPGSPDPAPIGRVVDSFAANHNGLAPIVVVVDQVGAAVQDTGCVDSPLGNSRTYVMQDVVPWIRANLNVFSDPHYWTIVGYSNGGQCAISFGTEFPDTFRGVVSVSGEEFPGSANPAATLKQLFNGDSARYEQAKPINMLAHAHLPDSTAVFTAAKDDATFLPVARRLAAAAQKAGMHTSLRVLDHGGHVGVAFYSGLQDGFAVMYPVLGLSQPGTDAVPAYVVTP